MSNNYEPYIGMPIDLDAYDVQISDLSDGRISSEMWPKDMLSDDNWSRDLVPGDLVPVEMPLRPETPAQTRPGNRPPANTAPVNSPPVQESPNQQRPVHQRPGHGNPGSEPGNCDLIVDTNFNNWPLAMAYVPMQSWEEPYTPDKGLNVGTIFPSLDLPFRGGLKR